MPRSKVRAPSGPAVACAVAITGALFAGTAAWALTTVSVAVPVGVKIPVALATTLTSQTTHPGDPFAFKTTKAENLGGLEVPEGTPGRGRVALASPAQGKSHGTLALQVDSIDLPGGRSVSVNVDVARPPRGHLSDKHRRFFVVPIPTVGIVPALVASQSGNLVLDAGTRFGVVTVAPRTEPAPLYTAPAGGTDARGRRLADAGAAERRAASLFAGVAAHVTGASHAARNTHSLRRAFACAMFAAIGMTAGRAGAIEGTYEAATTRIPVKLTERLSSQDVRAGDMFEFDTTASALVDGVFLPARTHGHGVVVAARSGHGPQPGLLELAARSLDLPNGDAIPVALEPGRLDESLQGDYRTAPSGTTVGPVHFGPLRTTNIVYERGTAFYVIAPPPAASQPPSDTR